MEKSWQEWVDESLRLECDPYEIMRIMQDAGFEIPVIRGMMGAAFPVHKVLLPVSDFDQQAAIKRLLESSAWESLPDIAEDAPGGILVIRNFLNADRCAALKEYADSQVYTELGVVDFSRTTEHAIESMQDERRITHHVEIDGMAYEVLNLFNDICCRKIAPFYDVNMEWYERPQILRYPPGGRYDHHADADRWLEDGKQWVRAQDRDYSILLYLNDAFEGGEIQFSRQDYTLKPSPGMLVTFPSDARYMHGALPTRSGIRYAIVSWAAAVGTQRVRKEIPFGSVYLRQKRAG